MNSKKVRIYYQIDYIDINGCAIYIDTFTSRQRKKAIEHVNILNKANQCFSRDTYYVLDKYVSFGYNDDDPRLLEKNITNVVTSF